MVSKILFLCSQNKLRSPTAEQVFSTWDSIECQSAGLASDAAAPVSVEQIEWADIIFVMENSHRNKLGKKFKPYLKNKRVIVLGIPDEYAFMDPELIAIFRARVPKFLRR
ncbi:MAG: low molecular weight protein tyrosine phosphatase family protein [Parvularculaceae bacterium]